MGRVEADAEKVRRFADLTYAARSWKAERRVIACVEATRLGGDTRFIVTNFKGAPRWLYKDLDTSENPEDGRALV